MATMRQCPGPDIVHDSDRGGQYRSVALGRTLRDSGIMQSLGDGDACDNDCLQSAPGAER